MSWATTVALLPSLQKPEPKRFLFPLSYRYSFLILRHLHILHHLHILRHLHILLAHSPSPSDMAHTTPGIEICIIDLNAPYPLKTPFHPSGAIWASSIATLHQEPMKARMFISAFFFSLLRLSFLVGGLD